MLQNLLSAWPGTKLIYLHVGVGSMPDNRPPNTLWKPGVFGRVAKVAQGVHRGSNASPRVGKDGIASTGGSRWVKSSLLAWLELAPFRLDHQMARWIEAFRPQVIYTWLGTPAIQGLVRRISTRWQVPTVVHIMDDWVSCKHAGNWLAAPSRRALVRGFEQEIAAAAERIAICDKMAAAYRSRYGREFEVVPNAIDLSHFPAPAIMRGSAAEGHRFTLGHVGRLSGGRLQGLVDVEAAFRVLARRGVSMRLELVGVSREALPLVLRDSPVVQCDPKASDERVRRLGLDADALLQVESFDAPENAWFRLSLSAKLPLYLALGRPVVAYGPHGLGSIDYVESGGCGVVIAERGVDAVTAALQRLLESPQQQVTMGQQARRLAETKHDRVAVFDRFRRLLARAGKAEQPLRGPGS